jgi:hypothetical protein
MTFDIGAQSAILYDGIDLTTLFNKVDIANPQGTQDITTFRPPGYAKNYISTLGSSSITLSGFAPMEHSRAQYLYELAVRTGRDLAIGVGGFTVGNAALLMKALKTNGDFKIMVDGATSASVTYQGKPGSPTVLVGTTLYSPHGTTSLAQDEAQTFTFTDTPELAKLGVRKTSGTTATDFDHTATAAANLKAALETVYGGTWTVTGSLTTTGTTPTKLYSGTLTATAGGTLVDTDVETAVVVSGEITNLTTSGEPSGDYTVNDCTAFNAGDTVADIQTAVRATGDDYAGVVVEGTSVAAVAEARLSDDATLSASTENGSLAVGQGFDESGATAWGPTETPSWVQIDRGSGSEAICDKYGLTANDGTSMASDFELQGSQNATDWTTLDSQTGLTWTTSETKYFAVDNSTAYRYYRVYFTTPATEVAAAGSFQILEIYILKAASPASLNLNLRFPASVGNITTPVATGTGQTVTTTAQGAIITSTVAIATTAPGNPGANGAIYAPATDGDGTAVHDIDVATTSDNGAEVVLHAINPDGGSTVVTIEHAPNDSGDPGTWATLVAFDAQAATGVQKKTVAAGTTINPFLRAVISDTTGTIVVAVVFARL